MQPKQLKEVFFRSIAGHPPNDWEIEEYLAPLADLPEDRQRTILARVSVLWPVSHSLCYSYLAGSPAAFACLADHQIDGWLAGLLDTYEAEGLHAAQRYLTDVDRHFLCRLRGEAGVRLGDVAGRLARFLEGIAGERFPLEGDRLAWTDGETIHLPEKLDVYPGEEKNYLAYRLLAVLQWRTAAVWTSRSAAAHAAIAGFLAAAPDRYLARDVLLLALHCHHLRWVSRHLAGLAADVFPLLAGVPGGIPVEGTKTAAVRYLAGVVPGRRPVPSPPGKIRDLLEWLDYAGDDPFDPDRLHAGLAIVSRLPGHYRESGLGWLHGDLRPAALAAGAAKRSRERQEKFLAALAALIVEQQARKDGNEAAGRPAVPPADSEGLLLLLDDGDDATRPAPERPRPARLTIGAASIDVPEDLMELARSIVRDGGGGLDSHLAAAGVAGRQWRAGGEAPAEERNEAAAGGDTYLYDEWDFRRNGFRRQWCHLRVKPVEPVGGSFVAHTRERHRGLIRKLRHQFELMRSIDRIQRRQFDGDDVDIDGLTDYIADRMAGAVPEEKLFVRLRRDERDIAVAFLVDMSSSTEGWVLTAMKESLLLMGEALDLLGDRFAIFGFSGMRRLRSELYHVKGFDEPFDERITGRIAGIAAKDYTRMGPPIRHLNTVLAATDARLRLLVVLSDGKPEDYDGYGGEYAVEDTRHALIEARAAGIHPFCITVDREAHEYIGRMYGEVDYVLIDDVGQLPARVASIYRTLTTG
ncbi:MAG: VWA domain-containing protein [Thermodesulfobacteriota bacterium]